MRYANSNYSILHEFGQGPKGSIPIADLLEYNGSLYGTTSVGGAHRDGTVFSISSGGTFAIVHSFGGAADGTLPYAGLINVNGILYGTTYSGGTHGAGTVYSIDPSSGSESVVYSFAGGTDGSNPQCDLAYLNGTLYGTTLGGGASSHGTVFSVDVSSGAESVLHSFAGTPDGSVPVSGLLDVNGTLYGTTNLGGITHAGTVYSIGTNGAEQVIHSFGAGTDGRYPNAGLIRLGARLYGTTKGGGALGRGTVFRLAFDGSKERVAHSFKGSPSDGASPVAALVQSNGLLYGTTQTGGQQSLGAIFSINPKNRVEKLLHSFGHASDGAGPQAALIAANGALYGTTARGGSKHYGTVFSFSP